MGKWRRRMAVLGTVAVLTLGPVSAAAPAFAQDTQTEDDDSGKTGLWGLAGLLGLAGLAGLARRDRRDRDQYGGPGARA